ELPSPSLTPDPGHGAVVSSFPNPPHQIQRRAGDHVLQRRCCSGVWRPPSRRRRSSPPPQGPRSSRHGQGARGHGDLAGTTGGGRPWRHRIWQPRSPDSSTWLGRDGGRLGPHHQERKASVSAAPLFPCSSSRQVGRSTPHTHPTSIEQEERFSAASHEFGQHKAPLPAPVRHTFIPRFRRHVRDKVKKKKKRLLED
uniref:Uncharacterized protein n=1 Tax=Triticum urartu TaxID=4572 RepID=A0A8R7UMI5_TRIUA